MAEWTAEGWAAVIAAITALITVVGTTTVNLVTLKRLGGVVKKVDGLLDKRVEAAQDKGNLIGRTEERAERVERKVAEDKAVVAGHDAERLNAEANAQSAANVRAIEGAPLPPNGTKKE